jgi:hypothetical protein
LGIFLLLLFLLLLLLASFFAETKWRLSAQNILEINKNYRTGATSWVGYLPPPPPPAGQFLCGS